MISYWLVDCLYFGNGNRPKYLTRKLPASKTLEKDNGPARRTTPPI